MSLNLVEFAGRDWSDLQSCSRSRRCLPGIVIIGGAFMGLAMACQIFVSLWDMWIAPLTASASPQPKELRK